MTKKTHHIATKRQIAAFISPTRSDIFQRLATLGPLSARQIAEALELPVTSLYHHLQYLVRVGLIAAIEPAASGGTNGRPAVMYDAVARIVQISKDIDKPGYAKLVGKAVRAAAGQASRDVNAAIDQPAAIFEGNQKNTGFFRTLISPSPGKLARVNALLSELRTLTTAPDKKNGQLITVAWFVAPVIRKKNARRK